MDRSPLASVALEHGPIPFVREQIECVNFHWKKVKRSFIELRIPFSRVVHSIEMIFAGFGERDGTTLVVIPSFQQWFIFLQPVVLDI